MTKDEQRRVYREEIPKHPDVKEVVDSFFQAFGKLDLVKFVIHDQLEKRQAI